MNINRTERANHNHEIKNWTSLVDRIFGEGSSAGRWYMTAENKYYAIEKH